MNKQKIPYEVPEAQSFVVRCEGVVCQSPTVTVNGAKKGNGYGSSMYYLDDDEE